MQIIITMCRSGNCSCCTQIPLGSALSSLSATSQLFLPSMVYTYPLLWPTILRLPEPLRQRAGSIWTLQPIALAQDKLWGEIYTPGFSCSIRLKVPAEIMTWFGFFSLLMLPAFNFWLLCRAFAWYNNS